MSRYTASLSSLGGSAGIQRAYKVFEDMKVRNVVAWTAIIRAYISVGYTESACQLFDQATDRDVVLWNTMILGYTERGDMVAARKIFAQCPAVNEMPWLGTRSCSAMQMPMTILWKNVRDSSLRRCLLIRRLSFLGTG